MTQPKNAKATKTIRLYRVHSNRDGGVVVVMATKKAAESEADRLNQEAAANRQREQLHATFTDADGTARDQVPQDQTTYYVEPFETTEPAE